MERELINDLLRWKDRPNRKPLVLNGARQVGKTWLLQELGKTAFSNTALVNLDNNPVMQAELDQGYDIPRLLQAMQVQSGQAIGPDTLLILDEIQECPKALTLLKYLREQRPDLAVAAAGSLLGMTIHEGTGFPVGKVSMLDLYPMTFREFLRAVGKGRYADLAAGKDTALMSTFSADLNSLLRSYFFVGGMPEAVSIFADTGDYALVREEQLEIVRRYEGDMSKHIGTRATEAVLAAWRSIPRHLSLENKRFVFGHVRAGARAREFREAITWLTRAGVAVQVPCVSKPGIPLAACADDTAFKLFGVDVGLLGAMSGLSAPAVINGNAVFTEFKGALTEQYVCQELRAMGMTPYYWKAQNARAEVDFAVQTEGQIWGIEVKAEENLRSKSLRAFHDRFPETRALRFSMSSYRAQDWMVNVPLYAVQNQKLWAGI